MVQRVAVRGYRSLGFEIMEDPVYRGSRNEGYASALRLQSLLGALRGATLAASADREPPRKSPRRRKREVVE